MKKRKSENFLTGLKKSYNKCGARVLHFLYQNNLLLVMFAVTFVAVVAKFLVAPYPTKDVTGYIFKWMREIREVGLGQFYTIDADYSPLYLFMVGLLSRFPMGTEITLGSHTYPQNWMLLLKGCYFTVDILNATAVFLIIRHLTKSRQKAAIGYIAALMLPVQFINSAIWGNSDCIYVCFLLYSLYFALRGKSCQAFLLFGFALANKLQAVFLAPFLVYLILQRKIRLTAVIYVPIAVLASFLPAYLCGAGFAEPFLFYQRQMQGYSKLTLGCANFWQLFAFRDYATGIISHGATIFALLMIGGFFAILWLRNLQPTGENLLNTAVFLIGVTVFFLPHMHERYFYLLDVLVMVYAITTGKRYFLIPMMQLSSGIAYYHYISGNYFIQPWGEDSVHIAAVLVVAVLSVLFYDLLKAPRRTQEDVLAELDRVIKS
ncbi:MAG: hypothetical protein II795_01590 [Firmicutes bacterium]|nr:hypothetical protein [Bacillota bacterium]